MRKFFFLILIYFLYSISVCAADCDVKWFDVEYIKQIEFCDDNIIEIIQDANKQNNRSIIYNYNGDKLVKYYDAIKVAENLYNGYMVDINGEIFQTDAFNEKGEILFSKRWNYKNKEFFNFYLWEDNQESTTFELKSNNYDYSFGLGQFISFEKKGMYALGKLNMDFITDFDYDFAYLISSDYPGKIILASDSNAVIANAISGNYLLNIIDISKNNNEFTLVIKKDDSQFYFADFDTLEIKGDAYDEYIGSLYGSAVFKKDGIRFVTDSKGNIKYKGNENICGAAFDKYIIEKNSKLGVINDKFEEIIPCEYDDINIIGDNVYILLKDGKYSLYNQNKILLDGFSAMECKYNYISADDGIYDFEGNLISKNEKYTYFLNKYGIIVYDEETKRAGKLISENSNPIVEIDGEILCSDILSRIKNNITLIPLRAMAEETGFNTEYIEETKEIRLTKEDKEIVFKIGDKKAVSNGAEITLNAAPEIINNRTLVPARAVSDAFGYDIEWDEERRLVEITTD